MSLLDALGLSGIFGSYSPSYLQAREQQFYLHQALMCIHGLDCPKCREQAENMFKLQMQQEALIAKKQLDYKNRCEEYIKNFQKIKC